MDSSPSTTIITSNLESYKQNICCINNSEWVCRC